MLKAVSIFYMFYNNQKLFEKLLNSTFYLDLDNGTNNNNSENDNPKLINDKQNENV